MRVAAILLAFVFIATPSQARDQAVTRQLSFGGLERTYLIHAPARIAASDMALVIVLHGQGGDGANILAQGYWIEKADAEGFIVVAPEGVPQHDDRPARFMGNRRSWNSGPATGSPAQERNVDDVGFIRAVVADVRRTRRVDARRIFATGFSNGAGMAFRVGAEMSDIVAAIAPVSNGLLLPVERLEKPVSLLLIWGTDDTLNPFTGGKVKRGGQTVLRPSAEASWLRWSELIGCTRPPSIAQVAPMVTRRSFTGCAANSEASFISVDGLGHQWPGGRVYLRIVAGPGSDALNATDAIWSFFAVHPR